MSRLTLRLPETLHRQLEALAEHEDISLNQYIVYALTRQATVAYTVQTAPEKAVVEQKAAYAALLQNLGQASFDEIQKALAERETVEPESGLTPETIAAIQHRIAQQQSTG
jgi:hypothetical protein